MKKSTKFSGFRILRCSNQSGLLMSYLLGASVALVLIVLLTFGADTAIADNSFDGDAPTEVFSGEEVSSVTRFLGGLHPLSVHFPLALIFAAFIFELLFIKSSNSKWRASAFHTLALGAIISLATISLGLMAGEVGPFLGPDADLLALHRLFGLLTSSLALIATYSLAQSQLKKNSKSRAKTFTLTYRITLALATITVFIAGHFGAELAGL